MRCRVTTPALIGALKLPVGRDGFFNEIHPKLRPVETVVDGVMIAGSCQGPKTIAESVASGLAAVTQAAAVLKRGVAELDPQVATVSLSACTGCGVCLDACPFAAIALVAAGDTVGRRRAAGRGSPPSTPPGARDAAPARPPARRTRIDLRGYTDAQVRSMIDELLTGVPG